MLSLRGQKSVPRSSKLYPKHASRPGFTQYPASDRYFLDRVQFSKVIADEDIRSIPSTHTTRQSVALSRTKKESAVVLRGPPRDVQMTYQDSGFVQMVLVDLNLLRPQPLHILVLSKTNPWQHPTAVFRRNTRRWKRWQGDTSLVGFGWNAQRKYCSVQWADSPALCKSHKEYYHFDSWRANVQPDLWLPTSFYVEESDPNSGTHSLRFRRLGHIWGYQLKVVAARFAGLERHISFSCRSHRRSR